MKPGNNHNKFLILDGIRSLACALIVFQHLASYFKIVNVSWGTPYFYVINSGELGVTLFIILSGLSLQINDGLKEYRYKDFIIRRFRRIYPLYWICLTIAVVIYIMLNYLAGNSFLNGLHYYDVVLSITGMYALVGKWGGPFIATSWFIGPIICLYLLFPLLSRFMRKKPLLTILCLLAISVASRLLIAGMGMVTSAESPIRWFPLCLIFEFGLGIYIAVITDNLNKLKLRPTNRFFSFTAAISFPLFLIHLPLLFILPFIQKAGFNNVISIISYLSIVIIVSWFIYLADTYIQNHVTIKRSVPS
jgi:peptidoglycan/LPS O-acetylase OafA/YrhL